MSRYAISLTQSSYYWRFELAALAIAAFCIWTAPDRSARQLLPTVMSGELDDFTGQLLAEDGGTVSLIGARQTRGATNDADFFGRIVAEANFDVNPPTQSSLRNTNAAHFARVLVTDGTTIQGAIQCTAAADAVLDGTVIVAQGVTITGCEHAPTPLP